MASEIERKFLIDPLHPDVVALMETRPRSIRQGYIMSSTTGVVRIRIEDDQAMLTIKGVTVGISRSEFEYPIPVDDAEHLLETMCAKIIEKKRYHYPLPGGFLAEVDVFPQIDLCLAEVEVPSEKTVIDKPEWFGEDVSTQSQYFNNNIADRI
ncbi:CYTH domain-containing protein [Pseudophaeobacter sp.]|uniref:CYTH domain-containing protein n=1 Tax=Pseudophaeobacter sp. TaxID=1971739 RepID=UPI002605BEF7|nr:CYTH domain-containing protein [Pseudophaeobacter sp.]